MVHAVLTGLALVLFWPPLMAQHPVTISVRCDERRNCTVSSGSAGPCTARYNDATVQEGWGYLSVHCDDPYAAGYAEGVLTHRRIADHLHNFLANYKLTSNSPALAALAQFSQQNTVWLSEQGGNGPGDPYWTAMHSLLAQQEGIVAGHNAVRPSEPVSLMDIALLNMQVHASYLYVHACACVRACMHALVRSCTRALVRSCARACLPAFWPASPSTGSLGKLARTSVSTQVRLYTCLWTGGHIRCLACAIPGAALRLLQCDRQL